ncbi:Protein rhomboid [Pseudolycoriella hygida]|uniref:Protein rhomboid n=1 Tax=Pseudolycoriella hygida TaxID=35572 RepID=A0A9Q0N5Q8_9DIPT|nr:Protein rhomboid [Pseudolycoriella hygida]
MEHSTTDDETVPQAPPRKWRTILRQNSEKIGAFVEDAVLPINQRGAQRIPIPAIELENVESQSNGPYRTTVTRNPAVNMQPKYFPFFIITISIVQVFIMYPFDTENMILLFGYDPHRRHEIWRYFTDSLVHTGLPHLWSNMLLQMILGVLLEIVHNWKRISVIYFASVLGGSLFITILSPGLYVVGASAGVYGLLFSHLSTIILNWNQMDRKYCRLFWLILYIVLNFILELVIAEINNSLAGHLGGAISGFLVSILVLKNFEKYPWESKMKKICQGLLVVLFVAIVITNIAATTVYLPTEWNFDYVSTYERFFINLINESEKNSPIRQQCQADYRCQAVMLRYNITVT